MNTFWKLVAELGLPIVATIGMGFFIMIIIKYILSSVVSSITFIQNVITQLDNRVKTMNNDILKIDQGKINHFIIFWRKMMKLLMKHMYRNKIC